MQAFTGGDDFSGRRIGFFGGTFDPPHRAHVAIARAAAEVYRLDQVLVTPTGRQPLKLPARGSPYEDRLAMVRLVCETDRRFVACDLDAPRADGKPNYTAETLLRLQERARGARLFAILGADSFLGLPNWREPMRLLELAEWLVVSRPGFELGGELVPMLRAAVESGRIHLLEQVHDGISATALRRRLHAGKDCREFLAESVVRYATEHQLYLNP